MAQPLETSQNQGKEQQSSKPLINEIKNDVDTCLRSIQNNPYQVKLNVFDRALTRLQEDVACSLIPNKNMAEIASIIEGNVFDSYSDRNKLTATIETKKAIEKMTVWEREELVLRKIDELYDNYKNTKSRTRESDNAWRKFVRARNMFGGERYYYMHNACWYIPNFDFAEFKQIDMPILIENSWEQIREINNVEGLAEKTLKENTNLQEKMAKAIGVLKPNESWADFINDSEIVMVEFPHQKIGGINSVIACFVNEYGTNVEPAIFEGAKTKYPGIQATIALKDPLYNNSYVMYKRSILAHHLEKGTLTPTIKLTIPASAFV